MISFNHGIWNYFIWTAAGRPPPRALTVLYVECEWLLCCRMGVGWWWRVGDLYLSFCPFIVVDEIWRVDTCRCPSPLLLKLSGWAVDTSVNVLHLVVWVRNCRTQKSYQRLRTTMFVQQLLEGVQLQLLAALVLQFRMDYSRKDLFSRLLCLYFRPLKPLLISCAKTLKSNKYLFWIPHYVRPLFCTSRSRMGIELGTV
jgi:hypothetical protein